MKAELCKCGKLFDPRENPEYCPQCGQSTEPKKTCPEALRIADTVRPDNEDDIDEAEVMLRAWENRL